MPAEARSRRTVRQKNKGPINPAPGRRVRELRTAQGLSQAQLAGTDFTKGFISLVEHGHTRMSLRAAEIIARRLGTTVAELLRSTAATGESHQAELLATRAEIELRANHLTEARDFAKAAAEHATGLLKARLQRINALILLEERRPRDAVRLLDEALRAFRGARESEFVTRCLVDLARAHSRMEQRGEALHLALEAEHALMSGQLVDRTLELQVQSLIAGLYVALGDYASADIRTERAKALVADIGDPRATAQLYESLAITREEQGDFDAALAYARRALAAYESLGQREMIGSTWNTIGWVYVQRRQFAKASEALAKAERHADETKDQRLRGYVLQTRAELELARGHADEALRMAEASLDMKQSSKRGRALSLLVKAQALAATRAPLATVNQAFEEAFDALKPFGRRQLARAYELHFEALAKRERFREAAESAQHALQLMRPALADT